MLGVFAELVGTLLCGAKVLPFLDGETSPPYSAIPL